MSAIDTQTRPTASERTPAAGTARGAVLVLPGRGDEPAYYRRLSGRLAADGYAVEVAPRAPETVEDVVAAWAGSDAAGAQGVRLVLGADTSAGLLATALAEERLAPQPSGAVFAGTATDGGTRPRSGDDELAERSACPVHRTVVAAAPAEPLAASGIPVVWPELAADLPVLAVHGGADRISPPGRVAARLTAWNAELVTVRDGLHDVLNDVHHRSVAAEIVTFLERLRADPSARPVLTREAPR
ncbi:alpha/beta hydrolase [Microbacterium album]|uniref:Lysophospholipase n=1 Tax=Microbacterium album TaxID=2053191 RepID=A0A917IGJ3_9MICO|nr:lysophospholipase [Microbacterium album]GGH41717.1 hypothetical protein GCM10010921_14450 [Microbacterium album]